jgi:methylenetetrahydrofolate dehydrogenase (NADP+)/methenyltetrahydrofolate cyclohydrolase
MLINGSEIARALGEEVKKGIKALPKVPKLLIFQIGGDEASITYSKALVKSAENYGVKCEYFQDKAEKDKAFFLEMMRLYVKDKEVSGIILQRPAPKPHSETELALLIPPEKDIDCANPLSFGYLALGQPKMLPPTPSAVVEILKYQGIETAGKRIAIVGRSNVVGKPLLLLLIRKGEGDATVTLCHTRTKNLTEILRSSEIVVSACGAPKMIKADMINRGATVIDAGINWVEGKMVGDVDFDGVKEVASMITPVPGGVGPVTRVMLFRNLLKAGK